jgi:hypothetical protein
LVMYGLHHSEKYEDEGLAAMSAQLYGLWLNINTK